MNDYVRVERDRRLFLTENEEFVADSDWWDEHAGRVVPVVCRKEVWDMGRPFYVYLVNIDGEEVHYSEHDVRRLSPLEQLAAVAE